MAYKVYLTRTRHGFAWGDDPFNLGTTDKPDWSPWRDLSIEVASDDPSQQVDIAWYAGNLFVAWRGAASGSKALWFGRFDLEGKPIGDFKKVGDDNMSEYTPALCVHGDLLYLAYMGLDNRVWYSRYNPADQIFVEAQPLTDPLSSWGWTRPTLASYGKELCFFLINSRSADLDVYSIDAFGSLGKQQEAHSGVSYQPVKACRLGGVLYVVHYSKEGNQIWLSACNDIASVTWAGFDPISSVSKSIGCAPALCEHGGRLYLLYRVGTTLKFTTFDGHAFGQEFYATSGLYAGSEEREYRAVSTPSSVSITRQGIYSAVILIDGLPSPSQVKS